MLLLLPSVTVSIVSDTQPEAPQKPQPGQASGNERFSLEFGQITEGCYYSMKSVLP